MANEVQCPPDEASMTGLVRGIINDIGDLIRHEIKFARTEMKADLRKTRDAVAVLALGTGAAFLGTILLALMLVYLLHYVSDPATEVSRGLPMWACYGIVSAVFLALGAVGVYAGYVKFQSFNPLPDQTAQTVKEERRVDSERELEVIRDKMEQTRANLADKLGALESQVRETVSSASETVTSTVEGVKDVVSNVSETVENVTETFNVSKHIDEHPWAAMGVALAAGFVAAQLFGGSRHRATSAPQPQPQPEQPPQPQRAAKPSGPSLLSQAAAMLPSIESFVPDLKGKAAAMMPSFEEVAPELRKLGDTVISGLEGLAVGGVMNLVRELAVEALPDAWRGEITKLVDDVTQQLGGKPLPSRQEQDGEKQPEQQPKPAHEQGIQQRPNEQGQGNNTRGRREGRNQLVGQG